MPSQAFAVPILPGKQEAWRDFLHAMREDRRAEYQNSRTRLGISREMVWHQQTPNGDLALIFWEGDDPEQIFQRLAASPEHFDVWFRKQALEIHGLDFSQPPTRPPAERVLDWLHP